MRRDQPRECAAGRKYHLGYSDFRPDELQKPMTGDLAWSAPTLSTLNPIGSPITTGPAVTAVLHSYERVLAAHDAM
jgi:hypothetical protein